MEFSSSNFFGVMSVLIGFVCLLLAVFLVSVRGSRAVPNRFLAAFLTLTALELSGWLWVDGSNRDHWINGLRLSLTMLQMPVFLGLYRSSCYVDFSLRRADLAHLIPAAATLFLCLPGSQIPWELSPNAAATANLTRAEHQLIWFGFHLQYFAYMVAVAALLLQFRRLLARTAQPGPSTTLVWLAQLALASFLAHCLIVIRDLALFSVGRSVVTMLQITGALLALGITTWIALTSLLRPEMFRRIDRRLSQPEQSAAQIADLKRLQAFMDTERPHLDPGLDLAALSEPLAMTPRELSELLNQKLGVHFFDFVNGYRIRDAQSLFKDQPSRKVLEIAHEVGFSSKSSFNAAFKKHTGSTPSAFRRQLIQTD